MAFVNKIIGSAKKQQSSSMFYVPTILEDESADLTKIPKFQDCQKRLDMFLERRKKISKSPFLSPSQKSRRSPVTVKRQETPFSPILNSTPKYKDYQRKLGLSLSSNGKENTPASFITPTGKSTSFVTPTSVGTASPSASKLSAIPKYRDFQRELDLCLSSRHDEDNKQSSFVVTPTQSENNDEQPSFVITPISGSTTSSRYQDEDGVIAHDTDFVRGGTYLREKASSSVHTGSSNCSSSIGEDFINESCLGASAQYYQTDQPSTSFMMDSMYFPSFLFEEKNGSTGGKNTSCVISVGSNTTGRHDIRDDDESSDNYLFRDHHERSSFLESSVTTRRIESLLSARDSEDESQDTFDMMRLHESSFILPSDAVPSSNNGGKGKEGVPEYIFIPSCECDCGNESNLPTSISN